MIRRWLSPQIRAAIRIFFWTLGGVAGLTFINFLFILHHIGSGLSIDQLPISLNRTPASVSMVAHHPQLEKTPVVELHCRKNKKDLKLRTLAPTARIRLSRCPSETVVVNSTNSSYGDLFALKKGLQTSDFLPLNMGENKILVRYGEKSIKVVIFRDKDEIHETTDPERPSS